jgi:hypothetical protein
MMQQITELADMDQQDNIMDEEFQTQIDKLEADYEKAERDLELAKQRYGTIEGQVKERETEEMLVHQQAKAMMKEYEQVLEEIRNEKAIDSHIIDNIEEVEKQFREQNGIHQKLLHHNNKMHLSLQERINSIDEELDEALQSQLNIQLLTGKPYFSALAIDLAKSPADACQDSQSHYFETVEKCTTLNINEKKFKFDKVLLNQEIDYFTYPHLKSEVSYAEETSRYMVIYLTKILGHVRRIQEPSNFYKGSFKTKRSEEDAKNEKALNEKDRKITLIFSELQHFLLENILTGVSYLLSSTPSDAQQMVTSLLSPMQPNEIKRVNLLTTNLDGSCD